jgi:hypothetical protein
MALHVPRRAAISIAFMRLREFAIASSACINLYLEVHHTGTKFLQWRLPQKTVQHFVGAMEAVLHIRHAHTLFDLAP